MKGGGKGNMWMSVPFGEHLFYNEWVRFQYISVTFPPLYFAWMLCLSFALHKDIAPVLLYQTKGLI